MMGPFDARLRATLVSVAACGAILTLAALIVFGAGTAASVGTGAALAAANLWTLARIVTALLPQDVPPGETSREDSGRGRGAWTVVALLKMGALFGAVWSIVRYSLVSPIPMLAGFASLPLGIAIGSLVSDRSGRGEH
ncbi:MAG TPA: ATP synthase subunit I [Polyangiaceae bacterium]|jgi:apolipoprotein N-acyltransferase